MEGNGIGFGTLLFLIFLTLKLTGYIDWSWWWVAAPLWAGVALVVGALGIAVVVAIIGVAVKGK